MSLSPSCLRLHRFRLVALGTLLVSLLGAAEPAYWPTQAWRESTPEKQGLDSEKLAEIFRYVKARGTPVHSMLVIRHGYVVFDAVFYPYDRAHPHDVASVTKSVTALLAGAAIGQQRIGSVRDPISRYGFRSKLHDTDWARVTVEDLLTMRSGLDCEAQSGEPREMRASTNWIQFVMDQPLRAPPGFLYSSSSMHLLAATVRASTKQTPLEFARAALFEPLGIKTALWPADATGVNHGWGDLHLFPRDMAKIGLLLQQGGRWEGRQLLPEEFVGEATRIQVKTGKNSDYGYGWWVFGGDRAGDFEAVGRGGQRICVLPRFDLILVTTGGGFEPGELGNLLFAAIRPDALPENRRAQETLAVLAKEAERAPDVASTSAEITASQRNFSGIYTLTANPLSVAKIGFEFSSQPAVMTLHLNGGEVRRHVVGFGDRALFSPGGPVGLPVAILAKWTGKDRLSFTYDEVSSINHLTFAVEFSEGDARFSVVDRTNPRAKINFEGRRD